MPRFRRRLALVSVLVAAVAASLPVVGQEPGLTVSTVLGHQPVSPLRDSYAMATVGTDLYFYDGNVIWKRDAAGEMTLLAGDLSAFSDSIDGIGSAARLTSGRALVAAPSGAMFLADDFHTIRRVETNGTVTTVAGAARMAGSADGVGIAARFQRPFGLAVDAAGVLYIADTGNHTIRRMALDGTVTTIAGSAGTAGLVDGAGTAARFSSPGDIAVDDAGHLWIADTGNHVIRRMTPDGTVTTVAGLGTVRFNNPSKLKLIGGVLYIMDGGTRIRRMDTSTATVSEAFPFDARARDLLAGPGGSFWLLVRHSTSTGLLSVANGWPSIVLAHARQGSYETYRPVDTPRDLATRDGFVYVAEADGVWVADASMSYYAQRADRGYYYSSWSGAFGVAVASPTLMAYSAGCGVGSEGNKSDGRGLFAGHTHSTIWGPPPCGYTDTPNGGAPLFRDTAGLTVASSGLAHVVDRGNHVIRRIVTDLAGSSRTFTNFLTTTRAGTGTAGAADGVGTAASFNNPTDITEDADGVLYVTDTSNHTIRRIDSSGVVTTLAGLAGTAGSADGAGAIARFNEPRGITFDLDGTLLVADTGNHTIRRVTTAGVVTTVAGLAGTSGSADGSAQDARFNLPQGVTVDRAGTIYVADTGNHRLRRLSSAAPAAPVITQQPASTSVSEGGTVTWSVMASGSPEPSYRWDYSDDDGVTWTTASNSREYRLEAVATTLHNRLYRCVIANPSGMVVSQSARLTVHAIFAAPAQAYIRATRHGALGPIVSQSRPVDIDITTRSDVAVHWTATANQAWVTIAGGSGTGAGRFTISANATELQSGTHTATVTVAAPGAGLTKTIPVSLSISSTGATDPPFGWLDIPAHGAQGLSGAIVVSGWALDDLGVDRVEIWRDLAPGESTPPYAGPGPGTGKVFVAHGLFVAGTRPDVEAAYPGRPESHRAGWGYVLLTYGFPDRGNGTFTLHAYAYDAEGQYATLGSKTITVDNNAATKPFGTIDYPGAGSVVSGNYTNNGWVLTPNVSGSPVCSITSVEMSIDSGPATFPVTYGTARPDVTAAFPGLSNTAAPGAQVTFDTTAFSNGLHTIGWVAYDSCGRAEGIGSRFITVQNSSSGDTAARPTRDLRSAGLETPAWPEQLVRTDVMSLAQLTLPSIAGATWSGYELVLGEARRLPIGSTLDAEHGRFYWQPMAGFFGTYALRFVARVDGVVVAQVPVRVIVGPGVRLAIESPEPDTNVAGMFTLEGWVADLGASDGTGIDAVHVWAYPVEGGDPIFAGHAGLGIARPDVAHVYGPQFTSSGYSLTVAHLPRGLYDVVVYPHSSVDGEFQGARVVRVHVR